MELRRVSTSAARLAESRIALEMGLESMSNHSTPVSDPSTVAARKVSRHKTTKERYYMHKTKVSCDS